MNSSRQAVTLAMLTALGQLAIAGAYVITARAAGPASFGAAASAIAIGLAAVGLLDFGSTSYCVREWASGRATRVEIRERLNGRIYFIVTVSAIWTVVAAMLGSPLPLLLSGAVATMAVAGQISRIPLQAAAAGHKVGLALFVDRAFTLLSFLSLLAIAVPPAIALCASYLIGPIAGIATARIVRNPNWTLPRSNRIRNPWRSTKGYGLFGLAISGQTLDLPVTQALLGSTAAGVYGSVQRWVAPLSLISSAVTVTAAPLIARASTHREGFTALMSLWRIVAVGGLGCLIIGIGASPLVSIVLGPNYQNAQASLQILAASSAVAIVNQPIATYLLARSAEKLVSLGSLIVTALQLGIVLPALLLEFGQAGAPLAFLASQVGLLTLYLVGLQRMLKNP